MSGGADRKLSLVARRQKVENMLRVNLRKGSSPATADANVALRSRLFSRGCKPRASTRTKGLTPRKRGELHKIKICSPSRAVFVFQIFKERSALVERTDDFHRLNQHGTLPRTFLLYRSTG